MNTAPTLRLIEPTPVTKQLLIANIEMQEARVMGETGLSIEMEKNGVTFFIPQPLIEGRHYSAAQLEEIETSLNAVDIELLPIDYNCIK